MAVYIFAVVNGGKRMTGGCVIPGPFCMGSAIFSGRIYFLTPMQRTAVVPPVV